MSGSEHEAEEESCAGEVSALAVPSELTVGEHAVENSSLQGCTGMSTAMITKDDHKIRTQKSDFAVGDYVSIMKALINSIFLAI